MTTPEEFDKYMQIGLLSEKLSGYFFEINKNNDKDSLKKGIENEVNELNKIIFSGKKINSQNLETDGVKAVTHIGKYLGYKIGKHELMQGEEKPQTYIIKMGLTKIAEFFSKVYSANGDYKKLSVDNLTEIDLFLNEINDIANKKTGEYIGEPKAISSEDKTKRNKEINQIFDNWNPNKQKKDDYALAGQNPQISSKEKMQRIIQEQNELNNNKNKKNGILGFLTKKL